MKCPNCSDVTLSLSERRGVEVDYCPQCRGVWLDRGELDTLIERSRNARDLDDSEAQAARRHDARHGAHAPRRAHDRHGGDERRRKSWLGDLFD
ncbi:TFIIB-type zinc ribbon-containing protein [Paraburkholderia lycopersici]|uniref:Transcription factor zinc-finger domain-containing protein n=1 Tax=Paraburkholderia lycopersici TaxID=416944 RepID=A0A1G6WIX5_9BURK|nr:zf-TFIIB domain-containing protein [Paraburkholderia lycopersici]SDD65025.1 hypothetical protein SAMN05421548_1238 [Paraburkholderia lycopersici]